MFSSELATLPFGLKMAQKVFQNSPDKKKRVTACFVKGGLFLADSNQYKTDPTGQKLNSRGCRLHAEMKVLKRLRFQETNGGKLFVYREDMSGSIKNARPCRACRRMIVLCGITTVYYTIEEGYTKEKVHNIEDYIGSDNEY